ncbi:MAG: hypothetical protein K2J40_03035 [Ruminococcus sp.]|nr:hypothetical protein [Ruminococcus sp.]
MKYITKDENISPQDKPKVFFTCHPDDVKLYFKKISDMILHYADCVVFYEENPDKPEDEENFLFDLTQMNLIVIPVTAKFLYQPCKARQDVLRIATEKHIALLPILEDSSMESEFNRICGSLHLFKMPNLSAVQSESEKNLKKYLESVLISNELVEEIRSAFDSYIFLSYRKKDRQYANELMKLIHQNDKLIGTAI